MGMPELGLVSLLILALAIILGTLWMRYQHVKLRHQERMAALEKGIASIPVAETRAPWSPRVYLLRGLIWTLTGAALTIAFLGLGLTARRHPQPLSRVELATEAIHVSQRLNIPLDQAREMVAKDLATRAERTEGPIASVAWFGLIPLGVGLAYLVYYRSERAIQTPPAGS